MRFSPLSTLPLFLCASLAVAQEDPFAPAKQVQKFAPMIGTWTGSGIVRHGPEGPEEAWTSKSSVGWALGGHFVREDIKIEMASMPDPLEMCNLYGWDRENERYVSIEVNNLGAANINEVHWTPSGKLVTTGVSVMQGMPVVERWVTGFENGKVSVVGNEAIGDGDFFEHVTGEMKRTSEKPSRFNAVDAAFVPEMVASAQAQLKRFEPGFGSYEMKGWFIPTPGAPKMEFSGNETIRPIFGGTVLEMISKGDPIEGMPNYEGIGWIGWDDHAGCYQVIYANNMGEIGKEECRFVGDDLVMTAATVRQGQPTCTRGVFTLDAGGFKKYTAHALTASMPPTLVFEATYTKK